MYIKCIKCAYSNIVRANLPHIIHTHFSLNDAEKVCVFSWYRGLSFGKCQFKTNANNT